MKLRMAVALLVVFGLFSLGLFTHFADGTVAAASHQAQASVKKSPTDPSVVGQWSAPIDIGMIPIHAALLYTGQVLFWQYLNSQSEFPGTIAVLFNPSNNQVTHLSTEPSADFFCAGATHLADGTLLIAGGLKGPLGEGDYGIPNATVFDPATNTFTSTPNMYWARYYPTDTALPNGNQLIMSGENAVGDIVTQLEQYNPSTKSFSPFPPSANLPKLDGTNWNDYPRNYLMPSGQVFVTNQSFVTYLFNPSTNAWTYIGRFIDGHRNHAAGVLLPNLNQVLEIGGQQGMNPGTNSVEMIDLSQSNPQWQNVAPMNYARHDTNAVLLPDGTVVVIGGASGPGKYTDPVMPAEIYNTAANTWTAMASQKGSRGYHSTGLLLPDGRVISEGSDSGNIYQTYLEFFSPPYLFNGPRPTITSAPTSIIYGQTFNVSTPNDGSIASIAFIREDAVTHADHMDQRMVNLTYTDLGNKMLQVTAPASANYAPPGYYMLFIVNSNGVPSVASVMQINAGTVRHSSPNRTP